LASLWEVVQLDGIQEVVKVRLFATLVNRRSQCFRKHDDMQVIVSWVGDDNGGGAFVSVDGLGAFKGNVDVLFRRDARSKIYLSVGMRITSLIGVTEVCTRSTGVGDAKVETFGHVVRAAFN